MENNMNLNVEWEHKPETRLISFSEVTKVLDKIAKDYKGQDQYWRAETVMKYLNEIKAIPGVRIEPSPQKSIIKVTGREQALALAQTLLASEYRISIKRDDANFFFCGYLVEYWED